MGSHRYYWKFNRAYNTAEQYLFVRRIGLGYTVGFLRRDVTASVQFSVAPKPRSCQRCIADSLSQRVPSGWDKNNDTPPDECAALGLHSNHWNNNHIPVYRFDCYLTVALTCEGSGDGKPSDTKTGHTEGAYHLRRTGNTHPRDGRLVENDVSSSSSSSSWILQKFLTTRCQPGNNKTSCNHRST